MRATEITPEHVRVLGVIPPRTVQAVAALFERRPAPAGSADSTSPRS
ncbi:hypothetical protein GXW71_04395 [Roseomonas hellenica]|uniref:Uncharacterized protein n=1 Tax=Plastoroseomonas hellenica TaxID=2687306 RepID=A0ABS5ETG6_9PROT|nr:hypothetical protein [Plastoroseomonas hellenica]MBR0663591.1 hypothetical protein [Plastoroseomonas hellenica]